MQDETPNTCWLAAYAIGVAFSPMGEEAALWHLRSVGAAPREAAAARVHLARMAVDHETRNRALHLLEELSSDVPTTSV